MRNRYSSKRTGSLIEQHEIRKVCALTAVPRHHIEVREPISIHITSSNALPVPDISKDCRPLEIPFFLQLDSDSVIPPYRGEIDPPIPIQVYQGGADLLK